MVRRYFLTMALALAASVAVGGCASGGGREATAEGPPPAPGATLALIPAFPGTEETETTVIVVRHAEKATGQGDDPHLSDFGEARARALARALEDAGVTAVITTQFVRTGETAAPTARAAGVAPEVVPVRWDSVPSNAAAVAQAAERHRGEVVLVVGHSNTVADIVAALGGEKPGEICESEYDRMEIVTIEVTGTVRLIESRYGAPTPLNAGCASMK